MPWIETQPVLPPYNFEKGGFMPTVTWTDKTSSDSVISRILTTASQDGELQRISFSKEVPDFDNGFVDFKFVVVGFGKEDIQVLLDPEDSTIEVKARTNDKVWHKRAISQEIRDRISFDTVSSKLENAVLTVSVSLKKKQKEIEVKVE